MKTFFLFVSFSVVLSVSSNAISVANDSALVFFPGNRIYPSVFLDPLECQLNGGYFLLYGPGHDLGLYSLVNLGFRRPVIAKYRESMSWEINFGASTFSQFDLVKREDGSYLAGLLNNDYKLTGDLSIKKNNNVFRLRLFHISSHLGDDYILRHNDTLPNDKSVNYEQADITWLKSMGSNYWYIGVGEIYTKFAFRERLSLYGGGLWNFGGPRPANLFTSMNIKLFAENNFTPDIRIAFGVNIYKRSEPVIRIWLEYYSGQLPYSTLDYGRISWTGPGITINFL